jgi:hypothetical protein
VIGVACADGLAGAWRILKCATRLDGGSDDFLCGSGISERFDDRGERGGDRHRPSPLIHEGATAVAANKTWMPATSAGMTKTLCDMIQSDRDML